MDVTHNSEGAGQAPSLSCHAAKMYDFGDNQKPLFLCLLLKQEPGKAKPLQPPALAGVREGLGGFFTRCVQALLVSPTSLILLGRSPFFLEAGYTHELESQFH